MLVLSSAGARAVLSEAVKVLRSQGRLTPFASLLEWPGFRRRLRRTIDAWTRAERTFTIDSALKDDDELGLDAQVRAQRLIFAQYRAMLRTLKYEDEAGLEVWASGVLHDAPPARFRSFMHWTFLELDEMNPSRRRVLEFADARAEVVRITLPFMTDPPWSELFDCRRDLHDLLVRKGFAETIVPFDRERPEGLREVEARLFRGDGSGESPIDTFEGLRVLGAPAGAGQGAVIAREVAARFADGAGRAAPDEILVLFRNWDDESLQVLETLRAWGIPASAELERPLVGEPSVTALRLAMRLPVEDWESDRLIRLLRHGLVRQEWLPVHEHDPMVLAEAAALVRDIRVFRGRDSIRAALRQESGPTPKSGLPRTSATRAIEVVLGLVERLEQLDRNDRWWIQVDRLKKLAGVLGLHDADDIGLEALWAALDEQGDVLESLGVGHESWSWGAFTAEVEALVSDLAIVARPRASGTVRLATLNDAEGATADHVILANLVEKSFPSREAVSADLNRAPGATSPEETAPDLVFSREMARFVRVIGSARRSLTLVYPSTDPQGQELLKAGFLDDLLRLFTPDCRGSFQCELKRLDPSLIDQPELAGAPAEARVRAVGLVCLRHETDAIERLARLPEHRAALEGTAAALRLEHARLASRNFGQFDGRLDDPRVHGRLGDRFGPTYPFSPSQLESYIYCPFQFFLRYVLKLKPVDDRDELDDDFAARGSELHKILETLERDLSEGSVDAPRREHARKLLAVASNTEPADGSSISAGIRRIEVGRLERLVHRYLRQFDSYAMSQESPPVPLRFELKFGYEDQDNSHPSLTLGDGSAAVRLQGVIDRLDLFSTPQGGAFRVIDYKTGGCPGKSDVRDALYLQLPLYALAVERLALDGTAAIGLHDVGYWGIRDKGFVAIKLPEWADDRTRVEAFVIDVVNHLRHGVFPVAPRSATVPSGAILGQSAGSARFERRGSGGTTSCGLNSKSNKHSEHLDERQGSRRAGNVRDGPGGSQRAAAASA